MNGHRSSSKWPIKRESQLIGSGLQSGRRNSLRPTRTRCEQLVSNCSTQWNGWNPQIGTFRNDLENQD
jgi:hypothetical protein